MNGKKMIALAAAAVMVFAAAGSAMAATIEPNPGKIDINHVENRFITTNIEYKGNGMAELTLLENEQYDAEAVKAIQPGDVIHSAGGDITVQTAEWDGPDLRINAEKEEEALLCDEGDGVFERVMEDGRDTAVVTHGGVIAAVMAHLFPEQDKNRYEWQPSYGRGYELEISGGTCSEQKI